MTRSVRFMIESMIFVTYGMTFFTPASRHDV